jgi:hypothetical protein
MRRTYDQSKNNGTGRTSGFEFIRILGNRNAAACQFSQEGCHQPESASATNTSQPSGKQLGHSETRAAKGNTAAFGLGSGSGSSCYPDIPQHCRICFPMPNITCLGAICNAVFRWILPSRQNARHVLLTQQYPSFLSLVSCLFAKLQDRPLVQVVSKGRILRGAHPSTHTSENVVEDEVAPALGHQIECLNVVHGLRLLVDLWDIVSSAPTFPCCSRAQNQRTISAPVTITIMPPCSLLGCASVVSTRWLTFWNGRFYSRAQSVSLTFPDRRATSSLSRRGISSRTVSFSRMPCVPWNCSFSKVSIDLSLCARLCQTMSIPLVLMNLTYVERG